MACTDDGLYSFGGDVPTFVSDGCPANQCLARTDSKYHPQVFLSCGEVSSATEPNENSLNDWNIFILEIR